MGDEATTKAKGLRPGRSLVDWAPAWIQRRRRKSPRDPADLPRERMRRMLAASRLIVVLAVLALGATALSAGIGYRLARQSDERLWADQRASLRNAIAEFRALLGQAEVDPRFVRVVEQTAGLKDLKFEADPVVSDREMQPVLDANGRIAGFFTWQKTCPMMQTVSRLVPLIVGIALALMGFAGFSLWQVRRARATNWR